MEVDTLVLHRFNGDEVYAVKSPTITASEEDGAVELLLYVDTKAKPIRTLPDTAELDPRPNAEVYITLKALDVSKLVGRRFSVSAAWDDEKQDYVSCLYYCEHGDLNRNVVRFLERQGNKFLVHWTATTTDVNYYDGSEPDTKVEIKAWFTFKGIRKWASAEPRAAPDAGR
ncbi:hypothetical protein J0H58_35810 [bacterium]|nr:hypothetical protein [bacterium]